MASTEISSMSNLEEDLYSLKASLAAFIDHEPKGDTEWGKEQLTALLSAAIVEIRHRLTGKPELSMDCKCDGSSVELEG